MSALSERAGTNVNKDIRQQKHKYSVCICLTTRDKYTQWNRGCLNYEPYNCKQPTLWNNNTELITQWSVWSECGIYGICSRYSRKTKVPLKLRRICNFAIPWHSRNSDRVCTGYKSADLRLRKATLFVVCWTEMVELFWNRTSMVHMRITF
jgi:hypothetical protein